MILEALRSTAWVVGPLLSLASILGLSGGIVWWTDRLVRPRAGRCRECELMGRNCTLHVGRAREGS